MLEELKQHLSDHFSFLTEKKLLIACSGGMDSIVLARLFKELKYNITLAHCNFSLRGAESNEDEAFVIDLADKLSVPVYTHTFDTNMYASKEKMSTQMAARALRYQWFSELMATYNFDFVLTAHHMDDDVETFFINLSRGTGLRGLIGIPEINEHIIRPLLSFPREKIATYADTYNLRWREDSSNAETYYLRNKIRHDVLPQLKAEVPNFLQKFKKTSDHLAASQALVEDYVTLVRTLVMTETTDGYNIDIEKLRELPNTSTLLFELLNPFGFTSWNDISDLMDSQSGKTVFSPGFRLLKDRKTFLITPRDEGSFTQEFLISENTKEVKSPVNLHFEILSSVGHTDANTIYLDLDTINFPLKIRKREEGDVFQPFGMKGKKKLSKFFKDEKLSLVAKEKTWVLCSGQKIIWVIGMRMSEEVRVTPNTENILRITRILE